MKILQHHSKVGERMDAVQSLLFQEILILRVGRMLSHYLPDADAKVVQLVDRDVRPCGGLVTLLPYVLFWHDVFKK